MMTHALAARSRIAAVDYVIRALDERRRVLGWPATAPGLISPRLSVIATGAGSSDSSTFWSA
jgi:hypothetical protein